MCMYEVLLDISYLTFCLIWISGDIVPLLRHFVEIILNLHTSTLTEDIEEKPMSSPKLILYRFSSFLEA